MPFGGIPKARNYQYKWWRRSNLLVLVIWWHPVGTCRKPDRGANQSVATTSTWRHMVIPETCVRTQHEKENTKRIINFAFMLLWMIGTSKSTHLLVLNLHGTHVQKSYAVVLADCWHIADTIALISTTSQLAGKDHVHLYMILVVMYHDTNPPFKGRDFAIHFISFVVS
jgi:hypothetical protein